MTACPSLHNNPGSHTYPQCFMFCGLSMRMASLILSSSGHPLETLILWSSHCLALLGVGWRTTWTPAHNKAVNYSFFVANHVKHTNLWPTLPSSLSSSARTPVLSVKSFTFTAGNGWVVVKSPWVPQLHRNETENTWLCVCQLTALCTKPQLHFNCKNTYMSSKYNHLTRGVPQSSVLGHQSVSLTNTRIHTPKEEHYTTRGNKEVSKLPKDTDICLGLVRNWTL